MHLRPEPRGLKSAKKPPAHLSFLHLSASPTFIMVYGAYKGIQGISRVYQNSSELQKFNAEVKRLEEEYNSILQAPCLPGLSNPQGQQFIERIDALVLQGKKFPGDHKALNQIEFQFKKLHKVRYCVINGEPAKGIRKDGVIPVEVTAIVFMKHPVMRCN